MEQQLKKTLTELVLPLYHWSNDQHILK